MVPVVGGFRRLALGRLPREAVRQACRHETSLSLLQAPSTDVSSLAGCMSALESLQCNGYTCTGSTRGAGLDGQALGVVGDIQEECQRRARGDHIPVCTVYPGMCTPRHLCYTRRYAVPMHACVHARCCTHAALPRANGHHEPDNVGGMLRKGDCERRRQGHQGRRVLADGYEELQVWPCAPQNAQEEAARCGRDRGGGRRGRRVCDKAEGVAVELMRAPVEVLAV